MPSWWSIARVWKGYGAPFVLTNLPYLYFGHRLWRGASTRRSSPSCFSRRASSRCCTTRSRSPARASRAGACFVDHGFAISTAFYFAKACWPPGPRSLALFAGGLALLPGWGDQLYTMTHSFWHAFSATAAYVACRERVARLRRLVGGTGGATSGVARKREDAPPRSSARRGAPRTAAIPGAAARRGRDQPAAGIDYRLDARMPWPTHTQVGSGRRSRPAGMLSPRRRQPCRDGTTRPRCSRISPRGPW